MSKEIEAVGLYAPYYLPTVIGDAQCPYRFSFRINSEGLVTLVIYEAPSHPGVPKNAVGPRLMPLKPGASIGFSPDQCKTILALFAEAVGKRARIEHHDNLNALTVHAR